MNLLLCVPPKSDFYFPTVFLRHKQNLLTETPHRLRKILSELIIFSHLSLIHDVEEENQLFLLFVF